MCGELSSYSDACSSIVLTYNNEIYNSIQSGFTKRNVCMLSGMCSEAFHPHADGHEVRILFIEDIQYIYLRIVLLFSEV